MQDESGFDRKLKFGTVSSRVGIVSLESSLACKLRQSAPGDLRRPLLALCWKTYMQTPIANPLQNCSTASNGSAVSVRPAVEELHKARMRVLCARQALDLQESFGNHNKKRKFVVHFKRHICKPLLGATGKMRTSCASQVLRLCRLL